MARRHAAFRTKVASEELDESAALVEQAYQSCMRCIEAASDAQATLEMDNNGADNRDVNDAIAALNDALIGLENVEMYLSEAAGAVMAAYSSI